MTRVCVTPYRPLEGEGRRERSEHRGGVRLYPPAPPHPCSHLASLNTRRPSPQGEGSRVPSRRHSRAITRVDSEKKGLQ